MTWKMIGNINKYQKCQLKLFTHFKWWGRDKICHNNLGRLSVCFQFKVCPFVRNQLFGFWGRHSFCLIAFKLWSFLHKMVNGEWLQLYPFRPSNTCEMSSQQCCIAKWKALLRLLPLVLQVAATTCCIRLNSYFAQYGCMVIRPTTLFNLSYTSVARQVAGKCCYGWWLFLRCPPVDYCIGLA